jgi:hypothetical protein
MGSVRNRNPRIAMLIKRLTEVVKETRQTIQKQTQAIQAEQDRKKQSSPPELKTEIHFPEDVERNNRDQNNRTLTVARWNLVATWATFVMVTFYATIAAWQWCEMKKTTKAAQGAVKAAQNANDLARAFFGSFVVTPQPVLGRIAFDSRQQWEGYGNYLVDDS